MKSKIIIIIILFMIMCMEYDRTFSEELCKIDYYYKLRPLFMIGVYNTLVRLCHSTHTHVFDPSNFDSHYIIQNSWKDIQEEALKLYSDRENLINMRSLVKYAFDGIDSGDNKWKVFVLKWYNKPLTKNIQKCPKTFDIINKCKDIHCAMFSILEPGKYIKPHKGPFAGCLRYHLGLKIPKDIENCYIKVNNEKFNWKEGEALIFDDTYIHEVYNNTNEPRIILFMDIMRPFKYPFDRLTTKLISYAPFTRMTKELNDNAEKAYETFNDDLYHI